jgi:ribosomal protein S1
VTPHTLKPGFSVNAKVQKLYANGIEVSFLGGMTGTIFADHIAKANPGKYKIGEKVQALVISQDIASKATALTLLPQLLKLEPQKQTCSVGQLFSQVKVEKKVYGNSYIIRLDSTTQGLLHKSNIPKIEDIPDEDEQMAEAETKDPSSYEAKKAILK